MERPWRTTTIHVNALTVMLALSVIVIILIFKGEYAGAIHLSSSIALVGVTFAKQKENGDDG